MSGEAYEIVHGAWDSLLPEVQSYVTEKAKLCRPARLHISSGSQEEFQMLIETMERTRTIKKLHADRFDNCWLVETDVRDIARVESKTFMCTKNADDTVPETKFGALAKLGNWMSVESMEFLLNRKRFPNSMAGRTMYVIPFSMGPVGSPLSKIGIQLTDSAYVVTCMRIMTRVGKPVLDYLRSHPETQFIRCLHSVGRSIGMMMSWPCDPDNTVIAHFPERNEICSYGSGYGGNSLLGKKCFALRIASTLARDEGWLAEHMLILGITNPEGRKKFITAAFPSACGKTNLAMLEPTLPGWKVECVGDDIAWMRYDEDGNLRAINPEAGFFGVAPGTSMKTNPYCMKALHKDTVFTNVGYTSDGGVYWEGMEDDEVDIDSVHVTSWDGRHWTQESAFTAAHKNSRFCTPAHNLETIDAAWEDPKGVPISAILFGGRRPDTVPLVFESFDWTHGVFVGASMRSMTTAASLEGVVKRVQHDPFAMRPFFGYNFGHYIQHWLDVGRKPNAKLPKIFHVNWFRTEKVPGAHDHDKRKQRYLWPGFGENCRVLEWIFRRTDGEDVAVESPIGFVPKPDALALDGLHEPVKVDKLLAVTKEEWSDEVGRIREYFEEQVGSHMPKEILGELKKLEERVGAM